RYRALVFGVDAATFEVIDPLFEAGKMPALAGLMARGVRAGLRSTWPPVSAPAWVTFLTGKQPGKHGVFNFQNFDSRHYSGFSETLVNSSWFSGRTLLDHAAGTAGVRTLSYRIPMTYPPWDVPNGVVVSGFPLPDRRRTYVRPVEAEAELGPASPLSYDQTAAAMKSLDVAALEASNRVELEGLERAGAGRARVATTLGHVLERGRLALPGRLWLKRRLPERLGRSLRALRKATGAIAWERTRAYAVPIHYPVSGVWVNLAGRQPKGTVAPGEEYEQIRSTHARELDEHRAPAIV